MDIFIIREGRQAGPFSEDAVRAFLTEGTARPNDLGWSNGMAEWRPLDEVLKARRGQAGGSATPPPAQESAANGSAPAHTPATAKQKAFLKYLGAEFGETLTKERAALAVSDALETPKLQSRIRKWHDEKLRMHADVFQDEIDFRKANRSSRYIERIQAEGSDVVNDVTKAHVQVLVESLDKRHPGWESDRESALWDYLLPAVGEHFPQLVLPAYKGRLKSPGPAKTGSAATRGIAATAGIVMPPPTTGTVGAMMRGVVLGVIALGAIVAGHHFWQQAHEQPAPSAAAAPGKKETPSAANTANVPSPKESGTTVPDKLLAEAKAPDATPENPPAPAPHAPAEPPVPAAPVINTEKPATPAAPEEKPSSPPVPAAPAMTPETPAAPADAAPSPQRAAVKLVQGIGVMLPNGQVTLPAGTILRFLATEGQNLRVSWNNNIFFVPAMATDVNEPLPAPAEAAASTTPAATGVQPAPSAAPVAPKPKKPADDL